MDKQELLKNPLVKEICIEFSKSILSYVNSFGEKEFDEYVKSQQSKKEWEITAFRGIHGKLGNKYIYTDKKEFELYLKDEWHKENVEIYSVKRLSDGAEFKIGDKYENTSGTFTIEKFEIENNSMFVKAKEGGFCNFIYVGPARTPLFTTEDGKEIFRGDHYYWVSEKFEVMGPTSNYISKENDIEIGCKGNFSSFAVAKEFILLNKPCLSVQDVINSGGAKKTLMIHNLKELVKSKLK